LRAMSLLADDVDAPIRVVAFEHLRRLVAANGGALPWAVINAGFQAGPTHVRFASAAEGIFKPVQLSGLLSIKTVVPKPTGRVWYHDQTHPDEQVRSRSDVMRYAFKGRNPDDARNLWLRDAMERSLPIIYFYGVAPAIYEPIFPVFVVGWDPTTLTCAIAAGTAASTTDKLTPPAPAERRYAMQLVRHRLHQAMFRERVVEAYGRRCALTGLPEVKLVDAAHIVPDSDDALGQPDIRNGICMSKIHHAAFDTNLIGIDPDFRIHVSDNLLALHDGPLLEQALKALAGGQMRLPENRTLWPDRQRLEARFKQFQEAK
jgi:putative restriction endonuclease